MKKPIPNTQRKTTGEIENLMPAGNSDKWSSFATKATMRKAAEAIKKGEIKIEKR